MQQKKISILQFGLETRIEPHDIQLNFAENENVYLINTFLMKILPADGHRNKEWDRLHTIYTQ